MKVLRSIILGAALIAAPLFAQVKPEEKSAVEYNIASCGSGDFTVIHSVLSADRKQLVLGAYLTSPTTVDTNAELVVFQYEEKPKTEDGVSQFKATTTLDEAKLELVGARLGNRIMGILYVNDKIGHLYYGFIGPVSDISVNVEDSVNTCHDMRNLNGEQEFMKALVKFLAGGSTGIPAPKA